MTPFFCHRIRGSLILKHPQAVQSRCFTFWFPSGTVGTSYLPKPDLPVAPDEEILMEVGDISPSGRACHQTRAHSVGHHSGEPTEGEIGLVHPGQRGHTSGQPL